MKNLLQQHRRYLLLAVMFYVFSLLSFAGSDAVLPHIAGARALAKQFVPTPVLEHFHSVPLGEWLTPLIIFGLLLQALGAVALVAWRSNAAAERESAALPILPAYRAGTTGYTSDTIDSYFDWDDEPEWH